MSPTNRGNDHFSLLPTGEGGRRPDEGDLSPTHRGDLCIKRLVTTRPKFAPPDYNDAHPPLRGTFSRGEKARKFSSTIQCRSVTPSMNHDIQPLHRDDLPELSEFLRSGFQTPDDAPFAAEDVLLWKYFDPRDDANDETPRSFVARHAETGAIVGHLGVSTTRFHGGGLPVEGLPTLHMIDWLSSEAGKGVGALLMRRAHRATSIQYGFGGSDIGRLVGGRGGYELAAMIPVYLNVLRPLHRLKTPGSKLSRRFLRLGNDLVRKARRPPRSNTLSVDLERVEAFGPEITPWLNTYRAEAVFTSRGPALLNHLLRYPRGGLSGFRILLNGEPRGFGMLTILNRPGGVREGRIVDCLLDDPRDPALTQAAIQALTRELHAQKADIALAFAGTDWTARALENSGYAPASPLEFRLRDRNNQLPRDQPFHLTPIEADYSYT